MQCAGEELLPGTRFALQHYGHVVAGEPAYEAERFRERRRAADETYFAAKLADPGTSVIFLEHVTGEVLDSGLESCPIAGPDEHIFTLPSKRAEELLPIALVGRQPARLSGVRPEQVKVASLYGG